MKIAIVQPNFFPFKAYYDLAGRVDRFIYLDDTRYNNKSRVNKTVINLNSKNYYFRVPLDHDPSELVLTKDVRPKNKSWKNKFLKLIKVQYKRSPNFDVLYPILKEIYLCFAQSIYTQRDIGSGKKKGLFLTWGLWLELNVR